LLFFARNNLFFCAASSAKTPAVITIAGIIRQLADHSGVRLYLFRENMAIITVFAIFHWFFIFFYHGTKYMMVMA
jgi:hypothetical protein